MPFLSLRKLRIILLSYLLSVATECSATSESDLILPVPSSRPYSKNENESYLQFKTFFSFIFNSLEHFESGLLCLLHCLNLLSLCFLLFLFLNSRTKCGILQ